MRLNHLISLTTGNVQDSDVKGRDTRIVDFEESDFSELLRRWNDHQALRSNGAPIADLAASHFDLDEARRQLHKAAA